MTAATTVKNIIKNGSYGSPAVPAVAEEVGVTEEEALFTVVTVGGVIEPALLASLVKASGNLNPGEQLIITKAVLDDRLKATREALSKALRGAGLKIRVYSTDDDGARITKV